MRNVTIDIAKGFGILMVVYCHTNDNFDCTNHGVVLELTKVIKCFYLPMFFILSGVFVKKQNWHEFFIKKWHRLLIPFIVFYFLGLFMAAILQYIPGLNTSTPFHWNEVFSVFHSEGFRNGALWFIIALFDSLVLLQFILRLNSWTLRTLIVVILFLIGHTERILPFRFPLYIGTSCITLMFVYIGYICRRLNLLQYLVRSKMTIASFIIFGILTYLLRDNTYNLKSHYFIGSIPLSMIAGITGSISLLSLSSIISRNKFLSYWGEITLPALCIHSLFTQIISKLVSAYMNPELWATPLLAFIIIVICTQCGAWLLLKYCPHLVGGNRK